MASSPSYKNLGIKPKQSPIEIKEKMRKNFKNRVQNIRGALMDKLRGSLPDKDLHNTLNEIYKTTFNFSQNDIAEEDIEIMDIIQKELVQEELEWWIKEYEQCQMVNVDWSTIEESNDVICPVCQKTNLELIFGNISCTHCKITIPAQKSLPEIKRSIINMVENHNSMCNSDVQFGLVTEINETHVYLVCQSCMDMKLVI